MSKFAKKRDPRKIVVSFLHWWEGKAHKVRLLPGYAVTFAEFHYTDEGWSSRHDVLSLEGRVIKYETCNDGRDCDGRLSHRITRYCAVQNRAGCKPYRYEDEKPCRDRFPVWSSHSYHQRDYTAESMGY